MRIFNNDIKTNVNIRSKIKGRVIQNLQVKKIKVRLVRE